MSHSTPRTQKPRHRPYHASAARRPAPPHTSASSPAASVPAANTPTTPSRPQSPTHSNLKFADLAAKGLISPLALQAIRFEYCTQVQAETFEPIHQGYDVLARAKTGTGKTVAFMLPSIERILRRSGGTKNGNVSILVLSPTRELAQQIATEAEILLANDPNLGVQCVVGGTNIRSEARKFSQQRVDILVATPGRLIDHIENTPGLVERFEDLQSFIVDEADRLLDEGFKPALDKIIASLPNRSARPRQTLLFSATLPKEVQKLVSTTLLPGYKHISTISETEASTHEHVKQELATVLPEDIFAASSSILWKALDDDKAASKLIVFLPTAKETALYAEMFQKLLEIRGDTTRVFEVHSRKSQSQRTKATEAFRTISRGILFSSDVTARGIDIPGVTAVVQIGLPADSEQYIHRLGRTARAGKEGHGILILSKEESFFLNKIRNLPIVPYETPAEITGAALEQWKQLANAALDAVSDDTKAGAYLAWIGYRNTYKKSFGWSPSDLVKVANSYAVDILRYRGSEQNVQQPHRLPPVYAKTVGKMGLRDVRPLFNVVPEPPRNSGPGRR